MKHVAEDALQSIGDLVHKIVQKHHLIEEIPQNIFRLLGADSVILYEYNQNKDEVDLPPIIIGQLKSKDVLAKKGEHIPHKESVVFKLIEKGTPFYASNAKQDWNKSGLVKQNDARNSSDFLSREGIVSSAGFPLSSEEEAIGVVFFNFLTHQTFPPIQKQIIELFSEIASVAIKNNRLLKISARQSDALTKLNAGFLDIAAHLETKSLLKAIVRRSAEILEVNGGGLYLCCQTAETLNMVTSYKKLTMIGTKLKFGQGLVGRVARDGRPKIVNDYHNWDGRDRRLDEEKYRHLFKSVAAVPLLSKDAVIGVLAVSTTDEDRIFLEDPDLVFLERFALQAVIAIENARTVSYLSTLVDSSPSAIIAVGKNGDIKKINPSAEDTLGYSEKQMLDIHIAELYWGGLKEAKRISGLLQKSTDGKIRNIETSIKNRQGLRVPILFSGATLYQDNVRTGTIGHMRDLRIESMRGRTKRLFDSIRKIHLKNELDTIFDTILLEAVDLNEADSGCIYLNMTDSIKLMSSSHDEVFEADIPLKKSLFGEVVKNNIPVLLDNSSHTADLHPISNSAKSGIIIPISTDSENLGLLYLESNRKNRHPSYLGKSSLHFSPNDLLANP